MDRLKNFKLFTGLSLVERPLNPFGSDIYSFCRIFIPSCTDIKAGELILELVKSKSHFLKRCSYSGLCTMMRVDLASCNVEWRDISETVSLMAPYVSFFKLASCICDAELLAKELRFEFSMPFQGYLSWRTLHLIWFKPEFFTRIFLR